jgi:mannan endo-1,4-beta-mannosidase
MTAPRSRRARGFRSGIGSVFVSVLAIVVVAGTTALLVVKFGPKNAAPPPPAAPSGVPAVGTYSHHPVHITLPTTQNSYLGAYAEGVPASYKSLTAFASTTGVEPNIALYYSGWKEPFRIGFAEQAADHKAVPLVQLEPGQVSLASIASGAYDSYLKEFATAVASFGAQTHQGVIIGFAHEPNGNWYPWGHHHARPADWIAAWRHLVDVFRQQGADDVTWLWTVNIIASHGHVPSPDAWWPGSSYVTWVGIDGYYYKPSWAFAPLFGPTIKAIRHKTLLDPILISETGAAPAAGKSAKIANLFAGVRAYGLLGFVWFDANRARDWRIDTPAAIAAYRQDAAPYHRPAA